MKVEFNHYDFFIGHTKTGKEVLNLKYNVAFDDTLIKEMKAIGVSEETINVETNEEE